VIGVDLQGHGRTPLGDREISLADMGNDMPLKVVVSVFYPEPAVCSFFWHRVCRERGTHRQDR
jgi:hypothetical protein